TATMPGAKRAGPCHVKLPCASLTKANVDSGAPVAAKPANHCSVNASPACGTPLLDTWPRTVSSDASAGTRSFAAGVGASAAVEFAGPGAATTCAAAGLLSSTGDGSDSRRSSRNHHHPTQHAKPTAPAPPTLPFVVMRITHSARCAPRPNTATRASAP